MNEYFLNEFLPRLILINSSVRSHSKSSRT